MVEFDKLILKHGNANGPRIFKAILIKEDSVGGVILPDCRNYYKATVIVMSFWCQSIHMLLEHNRGSRNRLRKYVTHGHLIFHKVDK